MSMIKKLTALLLLVMICGCLASCVGPDDGQGNIPDEPLPSDKYTAAIRVVYATDDGKMKDAVSAIGTPTVTLFVDGEDIRIVTNAAYDNISVSNEYVLVGDSLFASRVLTVGDKTVSEYKHTTVNEAGRDSLLAKAGPGADIGVGDFLSPSRIGSGLNYSYTCEDMTDESRESLQNIVANSFDGFGAVVTLESAVYQLEVKDGRNHSSILSCNFTVNMDGVDYSLTMHLYADYAYDGEFTISEPAGQDTYTETSIDDILG